MFITELSIKRPAISWVMSLILIIFGLFVFWKLPVRELPNGIQPPVVQVQVNYSSASASIVDQEVTQVVEDVIGGAEGIKNIDSNQTHNRAYAASKFRTAKKSTKNYPKVEIRFLKRNTNVPLQFKELQDRIGSVNYYLTKEESWLTGKLVLIENIESFLNSDDYFPNCDIAVYYSGNISDSLINCLNDLHDKTMNFKYKDLSKKLSLEAINKFYLIDKNIFQKNPKTNNDVFINPVDVGDNTIPNGNAVMLINFVRLGMMEEAKKLSESLNGYLNIYKNHMMTSLRAIDFYCNIKDGKNCNEHGCKIDV